MLAVLGGYWADPSSLPMAARGAARVAQQKDVGSWQKPTFGARRSNDGFVPLNVVPQGRSGFPGGGPKHTCVDRHPKRDPTLSDATTYDVCKVRFMPGSPIGAD